MPPARLATLGTGMEMQNAMHPRQPHWYLPWMGVRRDAQGNGVGSALLAKGLARVDADGLPVYLEATNWRNAAFYARSGFEVMGVVEAPGYPEIVAMWRPALSA
jgi:GNAT superfamily N-acetyltransferase